MGFIVLTGTPELAANLASLVSDHSTILVGKPRRRQPRKDLLETFLKWERSTTSPYQSRGASIGIRHVLWRKTWSTIGILREQEWLANANIVTASAYNLGNMQAPSDCR